MNVVDYWNKKSTKKVRNSERIKSGGRNLVKVSRVPCYWPQIARVLHIYYCVTQPLRKTEQESPRTRICSRGYIIKKY